MTQCRVAGAASNSTDRLPTAPRRTDLAGIDTAEMTSSSRPSRLDTTRRLGGSFDYAASDDAPN